MASLLFVRSPPVPPWLRQAASLLGRGRIAVLAGLLLVQAADAQAAEPTGRHTVQLTGKARIVVETRKFAARRHALTYCEAERLCLVDGYPVFGSEGALPRVEVTSLALMLDGKRVRLDHRGMFNPWSPVEGEDFRFRIVEDTPNGLRVRGEFSDGSAAYTAEWWVLSGGSARVLIDCTECVATLQARGLDGQDRAK